MAQAKSELVRCKICGKIIYARGLHSHMRHRHLHHRMFETTNNTESIPGTCGDEISTPYNFLEMLDAHVAAGKNSMRTYHGINVGNIMGNNDKYRCSKTDFCLILV